MKIVVDKEKLADIIKEILLEDFTEQAVSEVAAIIGDFEDYQIRIEVRRFSDEDSMLFGLEKNRCITIVEEES